MRIVVSSVFTLSASFSNSARRTSNSANFTFVDFEFQLFFAASNSVLLFLVAFGDQLVPNAAATLRTVFAFLAFTAPLAT